MGPPPLINGEDPGAYEELFDTVGQLFSPVERLGPSIRGTLLRSASYDGL